MTDNGLSALGERGVFLPEGHPLGVEEAIAQGQRMLAERDATIAALRAENQRLQESFIRQHDCDHSPCIDDADALRAALDGLVEAGLAMLAALDMVGPRTLSSGDAITWAFARGGVMADLRAALDAAKETP
jgi:hypothetical protein